MANYLLLFLGRAAQPAATDDETVDYNRQWGEYMAGLGKNGQLRGGAPLEPSGKVVTRDGITELELGDVDIGGFILVEADSHEAAEEIAGQAPHIALGGSTIVRECQAVG